MKHPHLHIIHCLYLVALLVTACQDNIEPDYSKALVINGLLIADSVPRISVTKNYPNDFFSSDFDSMFLDKAQVKISSIEEEPIVFNNTFHYIEDYYYWDENWTNFSTSELIPQKGTYYTITATLDGYPEATATTYIPDPVKVSIVDTMIYDSLRHINLTVQFTDPASTPNYYLLVVDCFLRTRVVDSLHYHHSGGGINTYFLCTNEVIEAKINFTFDSYCTGIVFSDKAIAGKQCILNLSSYLFYPEDIYSREYTNYLSFRTVSKVRLLSNTEDYYKYLKTLIKYNTYRTSPYYPPIEVYSNISGGMGILGGAGVSSDSVVTELVDYVKYYEK